MFEHDYKNYPELSNKELSDFGFTSPHPQYTEDFDAVVVKVHDGDTVTLRSLDRDFAFPLRFLDIDAKELSEGGENTRDWLSSRILNQPVKVQINKENRVDKYGRLLGRIFHNGLDVSVEMLNLGMVWTFENRLEGLIPNINKVFAEGMIK